MAAFTGWLVAVAIFWQRALLGFGVPEPAEPGWPWLLGALAAGAAMAWLPSGWFRVARWEIHSHPSKLAGCTCRY